MSVRVEVVTPCKHGQEGQHPLPGTETPTEFGWERAICIQASRRTFTEWPPEAIEAAKVAAKKAAEDYGFVWDEHAFNAEFPDALAAAWGHITGDNK